MRTRVIYCNPGEFVEIRTIRDPEIPKNHTEWKYQVRPSRCMVQIQLEGSIRLLTPGMNEANMEATCSQ